MADREVLLSGWLQKRGHVRTNWTERFFVLAREGYSGRASLYYYKSPWKVSRWHRVPTPGEWGGRSGNGGS